MKILAIIGSFRKNGNTSNVISIIKDEIAKLTQENDDVFDFEKVFLSDYEINQCRGCRKCYHSGMEACPLNDDMVELKNKIMESDVIIFASPVYINHVSGALKVFIDRLVHLCHIPQVYDKIAQIIITTHKSGIKNAMKTIFDACVAWGMHILGENGFAMEDSSIEEIKNNYHEDIIKVSKKIFQAVEKKYYLNPTLPQLVAFNIHKHYKANPKTAHEWPEEYEYWKSRGWNDPKTDFFMKHNASSLKILFARLISKIICLRMGD